MKTDTSWFANIWIAGMYADAVRACREFCLEGLCVTVTPTTYVYARGAEDGVLVRLIAYPRFLQPPPAREAQARRLAEFLKTKLYQGSYTIEFPELTEFYTTRPQDEV